MNHPNFTDLDIFKKKRDKRVRDCGDGFYLVGGCSNCMCFFSTGLGK